MDRKWLERDIKHRGGVYRITPGLFHKYILKKRLLLVFWEMVSSSDDFSELAEVVATINGRLVNPPPPHNEKG